MSEENRDQFENLLTGSFFFALAVSELIGLRLLSMIFAALFCFTLVYTIIASSRRKKENPQTDLESNTEIVNKIYENFEIDYKGVNITHTVICAASQFILPINAILWIEPVRIIFGIMYLVSTVLWLVMALSYAFTNFKKGRF